MLMLCLEVDVTQQYPNIRTTLDYPVMLGGGGLMETYVRVMASLEFKGGTIGSRILRYKWVGLREHRRGEEEAKGGYVRTRYIYRYLIRERYSLSQKTNATLGLFSFE